jgi:hypothetical protein
MGLLDDAIRDHIDLLRRRGADPTEIAKAEAEALGPVVREVDEPEAHDVVEDVVSDTDPAPEAELEEFEDGDLGGVPFEDDADEDIAIGSDAQAAPVDQATEHLDVFADEAPAQKEEPVAPSPAVEAEGDILEGTPDFLEESPDHDRLWFEQAPPKDFDFEDDE